MSYQNGPRIVTNGLVLCLDAGNSKSYAGSGTSWIDLSGNGNNGTLTNGPTYSSANKGSVVFDGTNDYVDLTTNNLKFNDSNVTINIWFKINSNTDAYQDLITLASPAQNDILAIIKGKSSTGGYVYGALFQGGTGLSLLSTLTGTNLISTGIINYSAVFQKINGYYNILLYKNGTLDSSGVTTLTSYNMNNWTNFFIRLGSGGPTFPEYLGGNIYSVQTYNRALSASEVLQNYNATKGRFGL